jgi:UrcA family protein
MNTSILLGVALCLAATLAQPASAKSSAPEGVLSQKVMVSDLDLSRDRDARILLQRVHSAARYVCSGSYGQWSIYLASSKRFTGCVAQASNRAVSTINSPVVTAMYNGRSTIQLADASPNG